jgi:UDP-glucose 4-epimerase
MRTWESTNLEDKKLLVTGGSGFIGTNLLLRLKGEGVDILNIDLNDSKAGVRIIREDLTTSNFSWLEDKYDYVVHLAALSNERYCEDIEEAFNVNVSATVRLLKRLASRNDIKKVIFMSSVVVYSKEARVPITEDAESDIYHNNYILTKGLDEQICGYFLRRYGMPILVFRLSNIYGPYQDYQKFPNLVPQIISQALQDHEIQVWTDKPIRDWIYIEDAVEAIIRGLLSPYTGILNLGTGRGRSVGEVVEIIAKLTGARVTCLNKEVTGPTRVVCDVGLIRKELNWEPQYSLEEGLRKTVEYYEELLGRKAEVRHAD